MCVIIAWLEGLKGEREGGRVRGASARKEGRQRGREGVKNSWSVVEWE